jgi:hypothetical protein
MVDRITAETASGSAAQRETKVSAGGQRQSLHGRRRHVALRGRQRRELGLGFAPGWRRNAYLLFSPVRRRAAGDRRATCAQR